MITLAFFVLVGVCLLIGLISGTVLLLIKLGVIANYARRPEELDYSSYSLDQGREVRPENERR